MSSSILTWIIAALATAGIIFRPFKINESVWAVSGAILLVIAKLIMPGEALKGVMSGLDVYLFLVGMMLLAEVARAEKLFDWLAAYATKHSGGSANRLFILIYIVGIVVTTFLSNDATAVVLTPAVAAAVKAAKIDKPLPYLFICAFIANAASFVLPISNPANLVIYGAHLPELSVWLPRYLVPSVVSIVVTFLILWLTQRKFLRATITTDIDIPVLSTGGVMAAIGIVITAIVLLLSSAFDMPLGLPTAISGIVTVIIVTVSIRKNPLAIIKGISWSVLLLVAGLFVIVEALNKTGLIQSLSVLLQQSAEQSITKTTWYSGLLIAFASNITNNLPSGLIAGQVVQASHTPDLVRSAILIGVDLGPNLSITGSLATLLWLVALRREGQDVTAWQFLKLGMLVMTVALLATLASLWL